MKLPFQEIEKVLILSFETKTDTSELRFSYRSALKHIFAEPGCLKKFIKLIKPKNIVKSTDRSVAI